MLRSIAFVALLCCIAHQSICERTSVSNETIFTRVIETRLPNPVSLVMASDLFTLSKTKQTLNINSTSGVTCNLNIDPLDENIQGRMNVIVLDNSDRKIIIWGLQKIDNLRRIYYTLLIVDLSNCSYKVVTLPSEQPPANYPLILPQIIPERANFLLFYPTQQQCNPCYYWSWGDEYPLKNHLPYHAGVPSSQFWVKSYTSIDDFPDYYNLFLAYNLDNGTALLQVLDMQTYSKGYSTLLNTNVHAAAVSYGTYQNTAICSIIAGKNQREVECARLNAKAEVGQSWKLPLKNDLPVSDVSIEVDKLGNTFIGVIDSKQLHFFVYNGLSELLADLDFGPVDEKYTHREVNGFAFLKEFCLAAVVYSDDNVQDTRHVVKCVDVSKYINRTTINVISV